MRWEDWVITIGQIIFMVSFIPTLKSKTDKPPISTSLPTGLVLLTFSAAQYSLGLTTSTYTSIILGSMWLFAAYQKYNLQKKK